MGPFGWTSDPKMLPKWPQSGSKWPSYTKSDPKLTPKCAQSHPHTSKVIPKATSTWPHHLIKSLKSVEKMCVFGKCTLIYPKWLHHQCKVTIKWYKVTHRYPNWPKSDPKTTSKRPESDLVSHSHHFGDFDAQKSSFLQLWHAENGIWAAFSQLWRAKVARLRLT